MTDVTEDGTEAELSAADEQALRELTERARSGGLKLTGEGGLLGKLTKMIVKGRESGGAPGRYPAGAGGPWLRRTLDLSRFQAIVVPSG